MQLAFMISFSSIILGAVTKALSLGKGGVLYVLLITFLVDSSC